MPYNTCNEVIFEFGQAGVLDLTRAYVCKHPTRVEHPHSEGIQSYMLPFASPLPDDVVLRSFGGCWHVEAGADPSGS